MTFQTSSTVKRSWIMLSVYSRMVNYIINFAFGTWSQKRSKIYNQLSSSGQRQNSFLKIIEQVLKHMKKKKGIEKQKKKDNSISRDA